MIRHIIKATDRTHFTIFRVIVIYICKYGIVCHIGRCLNFFQNNNRTAIYRRPTCEHIMVRFIRGLHQVLSFKRRCRNVTIVHRADLRAVAVDPGYRKALYGFAKARSARICVVFLGFQSSTASIVFVMCAVAVIAVGIFVGFYMILGIFLDVTYGNRRLHLNLFGDPLRSKRCLISGITRLYAGCRLGNRDVFVFQVHGLGCNRVFAAFFSAAACSLANQVTFRPFKPGQLIGMSSGRNGGSIGLHLCPVHLKRSSVGAHARGFAGSGCGNFGRVARNFFFIVAAAIYTDAGCSTGSIILTPTVSGFPIGMTRSGNLCIIGIVAARTGPISKPANFRTGGCLFLMFHVIVPQCSNRFLSNQDFVTDRAVLALGHTGFFAVGSHSCVNYFGVAQCINGFLCNQNFFTDRAVLALGLTGIFAVGSHSCVNHFGVAQCRNGFLCLDNSVTDRAMGAFGQTGGGTGGCNSLVNSGSVALGGNDTLGDLIITTGTMRSFGQTGVFAVRGNRFVGNHIVTQRSNGFLCNQNFVTDRAVLALGLTGIFAVGSHSCVGHFGVTQCINGFLCNQNSVTDRAVRTFGQTGSRTGRCNSSIHHFSMTQSVNHSLSNQNNVTDRAVGAFGQTGGRTGRCDCFIDNHIVAQCSNGFLLHQNFVTDRAVGAFRQTGLGTGGCHRFIDDLGVAQSVNYIIRVGVAAVAGISRVTLLRTGRSGHLCLIIVAQCSNGFLCLGNGTTDRTLFALGQAGFRTGSSLTGNGFFLVTLSGNDFLCNLFIAAGAVGACGQTGLGTGGIDCVVDHHVVTQSVNRIIRIGITALGAGMGGVTAILAGRLGHNSLIIMTQSVNDFLCNDDSVTDRTMLAFGQTGGSTGGCHPGINHFGVTQCINFFLSNQDFVTGRAVLTFGQTGSCTGRCNSSIHHFGVTQCSNGFLSNQNFSADRAALAFGQTGLLAVGRHSSVNHFGMTQSVNHSLSNQNSVTDRAVLALGQTGAFATGCHCFVNHFGMTLGGNDGLCDSSFAADRTLFALSQAGFRTGSGLTGNGHFGVTQCRDLGLSIQNFVTGRAVLALGQTGSRTGRGNICIDHFGVTQCSNSFLSNQNFSADRAVLTFGLTGGGTGGSNSRVDHFGVRQYRDDLLCGSCFVAARAVGAFRQTGGRTGRCDCVIGHHVVTQSRDFSGIIMFTSTSVGRFACSGTSGSRCHLYVGVAVGMAFKNSATDITDLVIVIVYMISANPSAIGVGVGICTAFGGLHDGAVSVCQLGRGDRDFDVSNRSARLRHLVSCCFGTRCRNHFTRSRRINICTARSGIYSTICCINSAIHHYLCIYISHYFIMTATRCKA